MNKGIKLSRETYLFSSIRQLMIKDKREAEIERNCKSIRDNMKSFDLKKMLGINTQLSSLYVCAIKIYILFTNETSFV